MTPVIASCTNGFGVDINTGIPYLFGMSRDFVWDPRKAARNIAAHGVPFEVAIAVCDDPDHAILDTTRIEDGEKRSKAIGLVEGRLFTVVYTMRGNDWRVISARRANRQEERAYGTRPLQA